MNTRFISVNTHPLCCFVFLLGFVMNPFFFPQFAASTEQAKTVLLTSSEQGLVCYIRR